MPGPGVLYSYNFSKTEGLSETSACLQYGEIRTMDLKALEVEVIQAFQE